MDYAIVKIDSLRNKDNVPFLIPDLEPKKIRQSFVGLVAGYAGDRHKKMIIK